MSSHISSALLSLDQAGIQMKEMLSSLGRQTTSEAVAQARMGEFVGALSGVQKCLQHLASTPPSSRHQQLQQEVQALQQELQQADQLLADADMKVNDWQADIQALRAAHEALLTDSAGNRQTVHATSQAGMNGTGMDAAATKEEG